MSNLYNEYQLSSELRSRLDAMKSKGFYFWYSKGHDAEGSVYRFVAFAELFGSIAAVNRIVARYSGDGLTAQEAVEDLLANCHADPEFENKYFECVLSHVPSLL
jgi:hypothetical protein